MEINVNLEIWIDWNLNWVNNKKFKIGFSIDLEKRQVLGLTKIELVIVLNYSYLKILKYNK